MYKRQTIFPGASAINVTNGEVLGTYPHPYYNTDGTSHIYAFHTGGTNVLLGDGSVRFLRSSTPPPLRLRRLPLSPPCSPASPRRR